MIGLSSGPIASPLSRLSSGDESPIRVAFLSTRALGNDTYARRVQAVIQTVLAYDGGVLRTFHLAPGDFTRHQLWVHRYTSALRTPVTARRKLVDAVTRFQPDILLINGWELAVGFYDLIRRIPTVLASDTTLRCSVELERLNNPYPSRPSLSSARVWMTQSLLYRPVVRMIRHFLPLSTWCAEVIAHDFAVPWDRISVAPPPIDTEFWAPSRAGTYRSKPNLLFIGNDFARKGGSLLTEVFECYLADICTLTVVSNDLTLHGWRPPHGVEVIAGLTQDRPEELRMVLQRSDIFVLPTRKDWSSQAAVEAAAMALPCVVTAVGGTADVVKDGETGYLVPLEADASVWASHLRELIERPVRRRSMGLRARDLVLGQSSYAAYGERLSGILRRLAG